MMLKIYPLFGFLLPAVFPFFSPSRLLAQRSQVEIKPQKMESWIVYFQGPMQPLDKLRRAIHEVREGQAGISTLGPLFRKVEEETKEARKGFLKKSKSLGVRVKDLFWLVPAASMEASESQVAELRKLKSIASIQKDSFRKATRIVVSTNAKNHAVDALQRLGIKGKGVTVAILDTGLDMNMGGKKRPHATFYVNGNVNNRTGGGINGSRILAIKQMGKQPFEDVLLHGTAVAGVAVGEKWNFKSNSDRGHAPLASIVGYSLPDVTNGLALLSTIAKAWQQVLMDTAKYKIKVANMSYEGTASAISIEEQAMDRVAELGDIVITVSAGNSGKPRAPFAHGGTNLLAVGAVEPNNRKVGTFSNRGPIASDPQRNYPHIMANGVNMIMPRADVETWEKLGWGTSFAAPQVGGAAALYRSVKPKATAIETRCALLATTEDIAGKNRIPPYDNRDAFGFGYLRDDRLVALAKGGLNAFVLNGRFQKKPGTIKISYQVRAGQYYAAVLGWNRSITALSLWSNFDLEVYQGKALLGSSKSSRNLYEKVVFRPSVTGKVDFVISVPFFESAPSVQVALVACESLPPTFIQGEAKAFGRSCKNADKLVPILTFSGIPEVGKPYDLWLVSADKNKTAGFSLGVSKTRFGAWALPLDLTLFGAPGCSLYSSIELMTPSHTGSSGFVRQRYNVPLSKSLIGVKYFHQAFILSPKANRLGLVFSHGLAIKIGG
jgi:subtilisin family serine protease